MTTYALNNAKLGEARFKINNVLLDHPDSYLTKSEKLQLTHAKRLINAVVHQRRAQQKKLQREAKHA